MRTFVRLVNFASKVSDYGVFGKAVLLIAELVFVFSVLFLAFIPVNANSSVPDSGWPANVQLALFGTVVIGAGIIMHNVNVYVRGW